MCIVQPVIKIVAGVLAAATIGGTTAVQLPKAEKPREAVHFGQVVAEDWGLIANCCYTYMVRVMDSSGGEIGCYLIITSDSGIAEYLGPDVARTWFDWELET